MVLLSRLISPFTIVLGGFRDAGYDERAELVPATDLVILRTSVCWAGMWWAVSVASNLHL